MLGGPRIGEILGLVRSIRGSLVVAARLAGLFAAGLATPPPQPAGLVAATRRLKFMMLVGMVSRDRHGGEELATAAAELALHPTAFSATRLTQVLFFCHLLVLAGMSALMVLRPATLQCCLAAVTAVTVYDVGGGRGKGVLLARVARFAFYPRTPSVAGSPMVSSLIAAYCGALAATFARLEGCPVSAGAGPTASKYRPGNRC